MSALRLRPGLTIRELPDGDAVVALDNKADAVIVNASAHAILELLTTPRSESEILRVFRDAYPEQDAATLMGDVHALVDELLRNGILEPCGSEQSTA
jgi:predicted NAD/FAD-binding protein